MAEQEHQPKGALAKLFLLKFAREGEDPQIIDNPHEGDHVPRMFSADGSVCPANAFAHGEAFPPTGAPAIVGVPDPAPGPRWHLNFAIPTNDPNYPDGLYRLRVTPVDAARVPIPGAAMDQISLNIP
jgi:hypothetical protein